MQGRLGQLRASLRQRAQAAAILALTAGVMACGQSATMVKPVPLMPADVHLAVEHVLAAHLYSLNNQPELALNELQHAQRYLEDDPTVALLLASAQFAVGDYAAARASANFAADAGADPTQALLLQLNIDEEEEEWEQALERVLPALEEPELQGFGLWQKAIWLAGLTEQPELQDELLERWAAFAPDDPQTHRQAATVALSRSDREAAARAYMAAARLPLGEPNDFLHAISAFRRADAADAKERALEAADLCLRSFPGSWRCALSKLAVHDGDRRSAEELSAESVAAISDLARRAQGDASRFTAITQAAASMLREDTQEALIVAALESARPGSAHFQHGAYAAYRLGRPAAAMEWMGSFLAENPADAEAHNFIGYLLLEAGQDFSRAAQHIEQAIELEPGSPHILDSLAWLRFRQGELDEALELMQRVLELAPEREPIYLHHLAVIHASRQEYRAADRYWVEALEGLGSDDAELRREIEEARRALEAGQIHSIYP